MLCKSIFWTNIALLLWPLGMREPRFVELNNEISDDVAFRIDLAQLHNRQVR
jgi:hypothetical protein